MQVEETILKGCYIITPKVFEDERGYFFESFNAATFKKLIGIEPHFVQDNQSYSTYGVLRGLHLQIVDSAQAKLVSVLSGKVWDVAVDLRPDSTTFKKYIGIELSAENKKQLYIPRGFAHGFLTLTASASFFYKCDNYYNKSAERSIIYNDPQLNIQWPLPEKELILAQKDLANLTLETFMQQASNLKL